MLILVLATEETLVNVDLLSLLNGFLAPCWLLVSPQQKFPSLLFPNAPHPRATTITPVVGQLFDSHLPAFGSS